MTRIIIIIKSFRLAVRWTHLWRVGHDVFNQLVSYRLESTATRHKREPVNHFPSSSITHTHTRAHSINVNSDSINRLKQSHFFQFTVDTTPTLSRFHCLAVDNPGRNSIGQQQQQQQQQQQRNEYKNKATWRVGPRSDDYSITVICTHSRLYKRPILFNGTRCTAAPEVVVVAAVVAVVVVGQ